MHENGAVVYVLNHFLCGYIFHYCWIMSNCSGKKKPKKGSDTDKTVFCQRNDAQMNIYSRYKSFFSTFLGKCETCSASLYQIKKKMAQQRNFHHTTNFTIQCPRALKPCLVIRL